MIRPLTERERRMDAKLDDDFGRRVAIAILVVLALVVVAIEIARSNGKPVMTPAGAVEAPNEP